MLVALRLRDEAACDCFISVIDAYQAGATQALTATKASRFVKMANEVALREWFSQYIPKARWPSLLNSDSLCSAVVNGKGGELMAFLSETQIPTDKWPSLLGRTSLCSAIVTGKGMDLKVCLEQSFVPKEKWHTVLMIDSLCSAMASGRPVDLSRFLT